MQNQDSGIVYYILWNKDTDNINYESPMFILLILLFKNEFYYPWVKGLDIVCRFKLYKLIIASNQFKRIKKMTNKILLTVPTQHITRNILQKK